MKKRALSVLLTIALLFTSVDASALVVNASSVETAEQESDTKHEADAEQETPQTAESNGKETETQEHENVNAETKDADVSTENLVKTPETEEQAKTDASKEAAMESEMPGETETQDDSVKSALSDFNVKGNNSIGTMLAEHMQSERGADNQTINSGCSINEIQISGTTATVHYMTVEDCTIIVGIYADNGGKLLAVGTGEADAGSHLAEIAICSGRIPKYYEVRGFLVRTDICQP